MGGSRVELDGLVFRRAVPDHQVIHTKMTRHRRRVNIRTSYSFISKGEHHYSYSLISVPAPIADQILVVNGESTCTRAPSQLGCRACQRSRGGRGTVSCSWHAGDWSNIFVVVFVTASTWTFLLLLLSVPPLEHFCCCYCHQLMVVIRLTWHRQAFPCYLPWRPQRRRVASPLEGFQLFFFCLF